MTEDSAAGSPFRALWARVRGRSGEDRRDACGEPWMLGFGEPDESLTAPADPPVLAGENGLATVGPALEPPRARALVGRDVEEHGGARAAPGDPPAPPLPPGARSAAPALEPDADRGLVEALHRVADSFEKVAASLDADRRERRTTLDDMDSLLRTLVGELRSPAAVPPVVVAGTIDLAAEDRADERRPFQRSRRR